MLSLPGTHGQEADWNDRHKSTGHVDIPVISSASVGTIPMISRLLKELGVPLDWIDSHDSEIIKKLWLNRQVCLRAKLPRWLSQ